MEDGLVLHRLRTFLWVLKVLILVVVEDGLVQFDEVVINGGDKS